jgi:signal peptidase I
VFRTRRASAPSLPRFLFATAGDLIVTSIKERSVVMNVSQFAIRATLGIAMFLGIGATMLQAFYIPAGSMEPSLQIGDHLLVNKTARNPQRGEMVVFRYPLDQKQTFIKRVIGLPGDRIRIESKQVVRNGERLVEDYAQFTSTTDAVRDNLGEVTVPANTLFVMGDNRDNSIDSRAFGFVPQTNVVGRPWMVYWSYDTGASRTRWDRTALILQRQDSDR